MSPVQPGVDNRVQGGDHEAPWGTKEGRAAYWEYEEVNVEGLDKEGILKWCGIKRKERDGIAYYDYFSDGSFLRVDCCKLDMNFYFKYAVPKLVDVKIVWHRVMLDGSETKTVVDISQIYPDSPKTEPYVRWFHGEHSNPAEAFGEALLKLIGGKHATH